MRGEGVNADDRWYRNGWVWLVIAIPGATVLGCLYTIYLALANPDPLVREPLDTASEQAPR